MNAAQSIPATKLAGAKEVFCELCETSAFLWAHYQIELQEAVDKLQRHSEDFGLVAALGQDAVQAMMAEPFALVRASLDEEEPLEAENALEYDLTENDLEAIARRVQRWEADDAKRPPSPAEPPARAYSTPQSTIDAFWYVVGLDDPDRLKAWLADRPKDAPLLLNLLENT